MIISKNVYYVGTTDKTLDLFEGQYPIPNGVTYNSYVIVDEKIAILDTCDARKQSEWIENVQDVLNGKTPDYLIISHMEPDHSASISKLVSLYPDVKLVGNKATFTMLKNFTGIDYSKNAVIVNEADEISLGKHTLKFFMAPMVHWPEVMVTFEKTEQILFSADAFGRFGTSDCTDVNDDSRRYFINIVGKYGVQVLALLAKASTLPIKQICPLHGPVLTGEAIGKNVESYKTWASYNSEEPDAVTVAFASIYGHTKKAVELFAKNFDGKVETFDLCRSDISEVVASAFKNGKLLLACSTYDGGLFTPMDNFLKRLKSKNFQNRKVALIENGTWAPQTAKLMRAELEQMKNVQILDFSVKIMSSVNAQNETEIKSLAEKMKEF